MRATIFGVLTVPFLVVMSSPPAKAQRETLHLASELGSVLGAEAGCKLKYDQQAIKAYIESKVKADDMKFPSVLQSMSEGTAYRIKGMSESEKTAFCAQIARVAKANKFVQ